LPSLSKIQDDVQDHMVKSFLDIIVLVMLKREASHGYAIIADIHKEFDVLLSPGTLYPLLYSLEKKNLISVEKEGRRKKYYLTEKGTKQANKVIQTYRTKMKEFLKFIKD
jgi:PadR family transcriptional regulator, activator of gas vesicle formation